MKSFFKKFLICFIIIIIVFNYVLGPSSNADAGSIAQTAVQSIVEFVATIGDGIAGVISYLPKMHALIAEVAVMGIMGLVATTFGYVDTGGNVIKASEVEEMGLLTPDDIFFNKIALTDINIFNMDDQLPDTILNIRSYIALWYYIMRIIAIAILLGILLYIAIRMAISTVASDKAGYKEMLVNWATSIALVFVLHYAIVLICYLNSGLVSIFADVYESLKKSNSGGILNSNSLDLGIGNLLTSALSVSATTGWASIVVVGMIIVQTFAFLIYYVKRMLTVAFLVIISPLITITYSIDKIGDKKAQALNTWLKEFFFTIIIQPFHCVIYMVFISLALSALGGNASGISQGLDIINPFSGGIDSLVGGLLAILCIKFVWDAEKMVKNIFGIKVSEGLGDAVASAAIAGAIVSKGMSTATKATGAVGKKFTKVGGSGTFGGVLKDFKNSKFMNNLTEKKNNLKEKARGVPGLGKVIDGSDKAKSWAKGKGEKIHDLAKKGKTKISESKLGQNIKGFKNYLNENPNGKKLKRYLTRTSPAIAAAMLGGAMMYGSSDKRSMFDAAVTGYGAYKGVGAGIDYLQKRKSESYEDNQMGYGKIAASNSDGNLKIDENDPYSSLKRICVIAQRLGESGQLSKENINDEHKKSVENLTSKLQEKGVESVKISDEVGRIIEDALNGEFDKDLDYEKIAKGTDLSPEEIKDCVKGLMYIQSMKDIYEENQNINTLAGQDDFYKSVWDAHIAEQDGDLNATVNYTGDTEIDWNNVDKEDEGGKLSELLEDYQNQNDLANKKTDVLLEQLLAYLQTAGYDIADPQNLGASLQYILDGGADASNPVGIENINLSNIAGASIDLDPSQISAMINSVFSDNKMNNVQMTPTQLREEVTKRIIEEKVEHEEIKNITIEERNQINEVVEKVANNQIYNIANNKIDQLKNS